MTSGAPSYGTGFYATRDEAEKARTFAILNDKADNRYHIFELEFPNPAHKGGWHGVNKVLLLLHELFDRRYR